MSAAAVARRASRWRERLRHPAMFSASTCRVRCWSGRGKTPPGSCRSISRWRTRPSIRSIPQAFDLLASRFGVMFFAEPALSFANLRRALRPSGRLAFACWREPRENPFFMAPLHAVYKHVPKLPQQGPEDPGPFAFASETRVHRILGEAGFSGIEMEPYNLALDVAIGRGLDAAVQSALEIGPASRALGGPSGGRSRRCDEFDPRGADAVCQGTNRTASGIDLDRDRAGVLRASRSVRPVLPRSPPDGRWSAPPFPCPARSPIPAVNGRRARRQRYWGRAVP